MGMESFGKARPKKVDQAVKTGDTDYLSAAGRKGAEKANSARVSRLQQEAAWKQHDDEQAEEEERARAEQANEHIIHPDTYND